MTVVPSFPFVILSLSKDQLPMTIAFSKHRTSV